MENINDKLYIILIQTNVFFGQLLVHEMQK